MLPPFKNFILFLNIIVLLQNLYQYMPLGGGKSFLVLTQKGRNMTYVLLKKKKKKKKKKKMTVTICDRAAEDEQVEKNRIKIRPCIPEILHAKV